MASVGLALASCSTEPDDWRLSDPNDSAHLANEMTDSRYYSSEAAGRQGRPLSDEELRGWTKPARQDKPVRLSGSLTLGVGARF